MVNRVAQLLLLNVNTISYSLFAIHYSLFAIRSQTITIISRLPFPFPSFSQPLPRHRLQYNHTPDPRARNQTGHSLCTTRSPSSRLLRRNRENASIHPAVCYSSRTPTPPGRTPSSCNSHSTLLYSRVLHSPAGIR